MDTNILDKAINDSKKLVDIPFPKIIELQTQSFCNGKCVVCPYKDLNIKPYRMDDKILSKLLNEIKIHKGDVERVIPYLNNEPSFDNRMLNILRELKESDFTVEVSTNISNWKLEDLDAIVNEGLIQDFRISFFGHTKELYESLMTGLKFEDNVEKVKYLLDLNKKNNNKLDIEIIVVLLPTLNVEEIKKGLDQLFDNPKVHFFGFLDRCGKVKIMQNKLVKTDSMEVIGCSLNRPYERCCIYSNGNVVLCSQDWEQEVVLGNINNNTIEEVWNSERAKHIRRIILNQEKCPKNFLCSKCKLAILRDKDQKILNFNGDKYMSGDGRKLVNKDGTISD